MNWEELQTASLAAILDWARDEPWARAMAGCLQDASWHAEGDVWTHTKMVCAELTRLSEWPDLSPREQTLLIFTALFHDAAKPLTTHVDPETGRVTTPKHAVKGEHLARAILRALGCDLETRETIARLVRYHGRPVFLLEKPDPAREVISLSWLVNHRLLYLFALADARGRDTDDGGRRPEENLQFWKLAAEEQGCFDQPYPFANAAARVHFYRRPDADLQYVPHEEYAATVTILSGLPGAGKDTWLAAHRPETPVVSLDDLRTELDVTATDNQGEVVQLARERCREHLRARRSFAFNATNLLWQTRQRWIDLCLDYHARVEIVYVEPAWPRVLEQNRRRATRIPEQVIRDLAARLEPPTWTECHDLIVTDGSA